MEREIGLPEYTIYNYSSCFMDGGKEGGKGEMEGEIRIVGWASVESLPYGKLRHHHPIPHTMWKKVTRQSSSQSVTQLQHIPPSKICNFQFVFIH